MKRVLILSAIFILSVVMISCGGDNSGESDPTCPENNKFCHFHDGLYLSDVSDSLMWGRAVTYCENLGGRLPTISELRTLIQNCPAIETDGECGVTDDCLSYEDCWSDACTECEVGNYSVLGYYGTFWSSSERSDETVSVWVITFTDGEITDYYTDTTQPFSAVCVKS